MTDDELVARARQGDAAAFGELVGRHQSAVHRAALSAGTSPADADDVAQEAFLLAYRRLKSFRGEASFKTWLLTIAWNQAVNHRRTKARWWRRTDDDAAWDRLAATDASPEELAHGAAMRNDIRVAVKALPHKVRDAFLLAQSGDYTYDEIAAMLKTPSGTIKWRVSEARRLVRAELERRGYR